MIIIWIRSSQIQHFPFVLFMTVSLGILVFKLKKKNHAHKIREAKYSSVHWNLDQHNWNGVSPSFLFSVLEPRVLFMLSSIHRTTTPSPFPYLLVYVYTADTWVSCLLLMTRNQAQLGRLSGLFYQVVHVEPSLLLFKKCLDWGRGRGHILLAHQLRYCFAPGLEVRL